MVHRGVGPCRQPNPSSTAQVAGHPYSMLIPFPIAGFVGTFLLDIALKSSGDEFWYRMGLWLLDVALIFVALAAVAGLIDVMGDVQIPNLNDAWLHAGGNVAAVVLELSIFILLHGGRELGRAGRWFISTTSSSRTYRSSYSFPHQTLIAPFRSRINWTTFTSEYEGAALLFGSPAQFGNEETALRLLVQRAEWQGSVLRSERR